MRLPPAYPRWHPANPHCGTESDSPERPSRKTPAGLCQPDMTPTRFDTPHHLAHPTMTSALTFCLLWVPPIKVNCQGQQQGKQCTNTGPAGVACHAGSVPRLAHHLIATCYHSHSNLAPLLRMSRGRIWSPHMPHSNFDHYAWYEASLSPEATQARQKIRHAFTPCPACAPSRPYYLAPALPSLMTRYYHFQTARKQRSLPPSPPVHTTDGATATLLFHSPPLPRTHIIISLPCAASALCTW